MALRSKLPTEMLHRQGRRHRGVWGVRRTPTFVVCTQQGVQRNLRNTPAGYCRLQLAAKVTQFTFGFSTWKFCFQYSLLSIVEKSHTLYSLVFTAMHFSAKRGIEIACRLSVCDVGGSGPHRLEILETNCKDN